MPDVIEVACATDDAYAPHCGAMLHSLLAAHARGTIRIHVLHRGLDGVHQSRLRQVAEQGAAELRFLPIGQDRIAAFPSRRFHESCWYRLLLPELLPTTPRVLYLDVDGIVMADLHDLWNTDLAGMPFGAAVNPLYPFMLPRWRELGLDDAREYLNSGVLLMDLERMRTEEVAARAETYAAEHPDNPWPEQDALSVVCRERWLRLHPRWNVQTTLFDLDDSALPLEPGEAAVARARPAFVHFIGPLKPWHYLCRHPLQGEYLRHRRQVPWPEAAPEGRTLLNRLLKPLSLGMQLRVRRLIRKVRLA